MAFNNKSQPLSFFYQKKVDFQFAIRAISKCLKIKNLCVGYGDKIFMKTQLDRAEEISLRSWILSRK